MAEAVADFLHGKALVQKALGAGVTQRVRAAALGADVEAPPAGSDDAPDHVAGDRADGGAQGEEDLAAGGPRARALQVAEDGLADAAAQRIQMGASRLGAADAQRLGFPIDVVQAQARHLAGAQAVGDEQLQHGAIAQVRRPLARRCGEQTPDSSQEGPTGNVSSA